jgi:DNA-binding HxlR family transcriptional regulator
MLNREYEGQHCSIAGTLELVGERWTLLILRDAFLRVRRFEDFQRSLGIARNVLSARLQLLCDEGILERRAYQERPVRY